jgi:hypothetical protein
MTKKIIEGFVIVQPGENAWQLSGKSFETSARGAWMRHIQGPFTKERLIDLPILIQRWHDKGYRLKKATLTIED